MNYQEITGSIHRMAYKRYLRGATKKQVIDRLLTLAFNTWKNNDDILNYIDTVIEEFENLITIRPFNNQLLVIGKGFAREIIVINEREIILR